VADHRIWLVGGGLPFMKRYTKACTWARHPEKAGQMWNDAQGREKFQKPPPRGPLFNFLEGTTALTPAKHAGQQSPYRHLLNPNRRRLLLWIRMELKQFGSLVDITIHYPRW